MDKLGIKLNPGWICAIIDNTQIILPNEKVINIKSKGRGYVIDRINFEKFLASQYQEEIQLGKRVTEIEKRGEIW